MTDAKIHRQAKKPSHASATPRHRLSFSQPSVRRSRLPKGKKSCLVGILALLALTTQGRAQQSLDAVTVGTLMLIPDATGEYVPATRVFTDVKMRIIGMVAEVEVEQQFLNDTMHWVEGVYAFPLPENAAVNRMRMYIGDRVIEGQIKEKGEAVRTYRAARSAGKRASLVTQRRPNLFTTKVANLGPAENMRISISYVQQLDYRDNQFSLRFPTAITPRYRGGEVDVSEPLTSTAEPDLTQSSALPTTAAVNPLRMRIHLEPGVDLVRLESRHHDVTISEASGRYILEMDQSGVAADRDFELVWEPSLTNAPKAALFSEVHDGQHYGLLMILPPQQPYPHQQARELILVIDTSGSMQGASLLQAKESLLMAIGTLSGNDRFNIVQFNSHASTLFPTAVPANDDAIARAMDYVLALSAGGGTEMAPALALALSAEAPTGFVRQVVFVTDGSVGNETALFRQIEEQLADSRLFTVGIGSAPNGYFMRKAAQFGRGSFTFIGQVDEVAEKMDALLSRLEYPMLSDVCVVWPGIAESYPNAIPDLYLGEPLVVAVRLNKASGDVEVCGNTALSGWSKTLNLHTDTPGYGISSLWARRKVDGLMDELALGGDATRIREQVIDVALAHRLVSRYTSFVAVDKTPVRSAVEADLKRVQLARQSPNSTPVVGAVQPLAMALPATATDSGLRIVFGCILLLVGGVFTLRLRDAQ